MIILSASRGGTLLAWTFFVCSGRHSEIRGKLARMNKDSVLEALIALHAEIDREIGTLADRHAERLKCRRGCYHCCVDEITVFEVEAERIRRNHAELLAEGKPFPRGACAFLSVHGVCRIYEDRPYLCRTQGLPLRWIEEHEEDEVDAPDEAVEMRDICPLNERADEPLEQLDASECWTLGPYEGMLAQLQAAFGSDSMHRVRLRDLFRAPAGRAQRG
ncbi:MAG: YkgJ family cysteine cluster protein [Acidobacteriota bacterium]|nr:MAG: YkgJ family cysteine cluster protein [Acidobacteriota bacterium]